MSVQRSATGQRRARQLGKECPPLADAEEPCKESGAVVKRCVPAHWCGATCACWPVVAQLSSLPALTAAPAHGPCLPCCPGCLRGPQATRAARLQPTNSWQLSLAALPNKLQLCLPTLAAALQLLLLLLPSSCCMCCRCAAPAPLLHASSRRAVWGGRTEKRSAGRTAAPAGSRLA